MHSANTMPYSTMKLATLNAITFIKAAERLVADLLRQLLRDRYPHTVNFNQVKVHSDKRHKNPLLLLLTVLCFIY